MFERYTEGARRTVFFAHFEASQSGGSIETEHLLLGVLWADRRLANQLLGSFFALEDLRHSIELKRNTGPKAPISVDVPLSHESKRALACAAQESQRLDHERIDTGHLVLGLLQDEKSFAAQLLRERGVTLESSREQVNRFCQQAAYDESASIAGLNLWIAERKAEAGGWIIEQRGQGNAVHFALYPSDESKEHGDDQGAPPAENLARIQNRIAFIIDRIEHAIANHEFEKARLYSEEQRKEREHLRGLCAELSLEAPPPRVPLLCIAVIGERNHSEVRQRCDAFIAEGVAEVWLLDPRLKCAYTFTKTQGLREFKGETLRFVSPPLEMELGRIFE